MKTNVPDIGEQAPPFTILTADNQNFELRSALKSKKNLVLVFYRGHW